MSPREALQSPVAMFYLALVCGLLVAAGPILWIVRHRARTAWQAYLGWLVIVPVTAAALFLGRETAIVFLTGVAIQGFREFARATGLATDGCLTASVCLGILAEGLAALLPEPGKPGHGWFDLFATLPVVVVPAILIVPIVRNRVRGQLHFLAMAITAFVFFGWMFGHVTFLTNSRHAYAYLAYLLFAVEVNDIAAFLAGKTFGRHVLRSNISPRKTWEGSLGALAVSLALPWALWWTFPHLRPVDLVTIGLITGMGGQLGDLVVSVIKRDLGIKDMGATIPGHGGILDRIDSLIYVAPLFFHYLRHRHELALLS
jgi:phosphatidate cytidylyltransferase